MGLVVFLNVTTVIVVASSSKKHKNNDTIYVRKLIRTNHNAGYFFGLRNGFVASVIFLIPQRFNFIDLSGWI